ncbi:MAG: T9SS type A sorting domain-containing protein [Bacteroidota bacterium]|nr:T9SS type A sorting domain-containing protein [Bacteroidota bacterium]
MKTLYTLILFIGFSVAVQAQITNINPTVGILGQDLQTTITGSGIFVQNSTPSGNIYRIRLVKGVDQIMIFDWAQIWNFWAAATIIDPNTVIADLEIPLTAVPGVYDVEVIIGDIGDPSFNQFTYTLPAAFTVAPPDGYITGTAYRDVNKNGVKDIGEPGIAYRNLVLLPINYSAITDLNGNYSFPVVNGTYSVVIQNNFYDYLFNTTSDTITATINNNNSPGNDFGLKGAMVSITPSVAYRGVTTLHQIVADEPIFIPGGPASGNIIQFFVNGSPTGGFTVQLSSLNVIDSFTVNANITVPISSPVSVRDLQIYTSPGYVAYHFLRQQLTITDPPSSITGTVFFDQNQDKIFNTGEPGINQAKLVMTPDNSIAFTNAAGAYEFGTLGGVQTVAPSFNFPGLILFTDSTSYTVNAVGNITGKNFGYVSTAPDYSILVKDPYVFPRCNTQQNVTFKIRNYSNTPYNAVVWIKKDPLMVFASSPFTPTLISNDTIYWNFTNLLPYTEVQMVAKFALPGAGNTITFTTGATSLNSSGIPQLSHELVNSVIIFCAMDPNDKQVTPPGIFAQNFTLMSDTLEYLIRFQNTGNDTAFNVVVLDTLDSDLNYNTFEVLGSSHSMQTELKSNGALRFEFNNILLVDSNANEPESHGYIRYRIRSIAGLPDSTEVLNTAYIYFDFNAAVVTNTTLNTLVYVLPVGIDEPGSVSEVTLYPNPFDQSATLSFNNPEKHIYTLVVTEITGKQVAVATTTGNRFEIDRGSLSGGIYFYRLMNAALNKSFTGKFIVK